MFSDQTTEKLLASGIDIEQSYQLLQLEIRMGGPVYQRLQMALQGYDYSNNDHWEGRNITDHQRSLTDNHVAALPRIDRKKLTVGSGKRSTP